LENFEVPTPILNNPFDEPSTHWYIAPGETPEQRPGRRPAGYFYRLITKGQEHEEEASIRDSVWLELKTVELIRERLKEWRKLGYPGASKVTTELLEHWKRDGRRQRLFFAQLEAAETIIFLNEARPDYLQGIDVPLEELSAEKQAEGFKAFRRYACKMATGSGKTTVMGMLAAWSILNKVSDRRDARFSDVVLVVAPNVTIRNRLKELDPRLEDASIYRTRDLVPGTLMGDLANGRVLVVNWHTFEPQTSQAGGVSAKVVRTGIQVRTRETIHIGPATTTARGRRYLTLKDLERQCAAGLLTVIEEQKGKDGSLKSVAVESVRYVESDTHLLNRLLGREVGGKQNILVFNDEAHHAYRILNEKPDEWEEMDDEDQELWQSDRKEATIWVDGLDKINKHRGINFCVDLSATPYYLANVGQPTNRAFPWIVSDFGLTDAIESGLVKIPQLAVRDSTGEEVPGYFNIWRWILRRLTPSERGAKKGGPKPEAILKYANTPIAMLAGLWSNLLNNVDPEDPRPPVFILVCKNTKIAKLIYEWLGEDNPPRGIPTVGVPGFANKDGQINTIRVDTKVIEESDTEGSKSDEVAWMRATLDTVGRVSWPTDTQGRPLYPEGFEALATKLKRPLHPPGRDIRCIVSVGMLTEGWDCNTVSHIVGLRPFMSQLLCEQVVGRGLRRRNYTDFDDDGKLKEEVAKVFGVPFEVIPFKQSENTNTSARPKQHHIHALPERAHFEIKFPRVEGYQQAIRNRVAVDWNAFAPVELDPTSIPPEVDMKAGLPNNKGRYTLTGPGKIENVSLNPYREGRRLQQLAFEMAADLTRDYVNLESCEAPPHVLFPQILDIVNRVLANFVVPRKPAVVLDVFLSPYYGWVIERLSQAIHPDIHEGEAPEVPRFEANRGPGTTSEVDYWTSKDVREVVHSHVNYVVADTKQWEQSAAYFIDNHSAVESFVKNAGLGLAIPYFHNGQFHDYQPDFLIRLKCHEERYLVLETKGFDPLRDVKKQAALRWVNAVNAAGMYGRWRFELARSVEEVTLKLDEAAESVT
jgi:type III restriction enzyme